MSSDLCTALSNHDPERSASHNPLSTHFIIQNFKVLMSRFVRQPKLIFSPEMLSEHRYNQFLTTGFKSRTLKKRPLSSHLSLDTEVDSPAHPAAAESLRILSGR